MVKIFVGGFPLDTNELELVQLVSPYCEVSTIKIVRDKKTRICKGYAFLEVTTEQGAEQAVEALDGSTMGGRDLKLSIVEEKPPVPVKPRFVRTDRPSGGGYSGNSGYSGRPSGQSPDPSKPKRPRKTL